MYAGAQVLAAKCFDGLYSLQQLLVSSSLSIEGSIYPVDPITCVPLPTLSQ